MRKSTVFAVTIFIILFIVAFASGCKKEQTLTELNYEKLTSNLWVSENDDLIKFTKDYKIVGYGADMSFTYSLVDNELTTICNYSNRIFTSRYSIEWGEGLLILKSLDNNSNSIYRKYK